MATATKTLLTTAEAARELGALEYHTRLALRGARYAVRAGRCRFIDPRDLPKLAAALRAAGRLPAEAATAG